MRSYGRALIWWDRCPYKRKRHQRVLSLSLSVEWRKANGRRWLSANQKERSHQTLTLNIGHLNIGLLVSQDLNIGLLVSQDCKRRNFCCLSCPMCGMCAGILLWHGFAEQTNSSSEVRQTWVLIPTLHSMSYMALGKSFKLSEHQFLHLSNRAALWGWRCNAIRVRSLNSAQHRVAQMDDMSGWYVPLMQESLGPSERIIGKLDYHPLPKDLTILEDRAGPQLQLRITCLQELSF